MPTRLLKRNYKYDIFLSYAHVDDEPLFGANKGWVSTFIEGLKVHLAKELGRKDAFSLWTDEEISRFESVTAQIMDAVKNSAILMVILSPGYLASEWCKKERKTFLEAVREQIQSDSRVFIIELDRTEISERPEELRDLIGYQFWVSEGGATSILGWPTPIHNNPGHINYYKELNRLSKELAKELKRLRSPGDERQVLIQ